MYSLNDDKQNYTFCRLQLVVKRLDTQLNEPTNQNSEKFNSNVYYFNPGNVPSLPGFFLSNGPLVHSKIT